MWDLDSVLFYFYLGMAILAILGCGSGMVSQSRTETIHPFKAFGHLLAFYLAYLLIPLFFLQYLCWMDGLLFTA